MPSQSVRTDFSDRGAMLADIDRQAATLGKVLARVDEITAFADAALRPGPTGQTHVFGSGDGWFAARAAVPRSGKIRAHSGLDFTLNTAPAIGPDDRALAISMSGNVDRTLEGAKIAQQQGVPLAIITNGAGGRLGALGGALYSLDIPDLAPFLCGTSSYTATLATLQLGFAALDGDARFADALQMLVPTLPGFIKEADHFAQSVAAQVAESCEGARILGVGTSVATADYGAAKLVEVSKVPVWSDDIEEFAHRQYWSMRASEIVVLLPLDESSAHYADATADALGDIDVATIALEPLGTAVPSAKHRLTLPGGGRTAAITQAIALQLLAYHLGVASGTDPNKREHLKNDQARFNASRKLTRRSLIGTGQ